MAPPRQRSNAPSRELLLLKGSLVPVDPDNLTADDEHAILNAISALRNVCKSILPYRNKDKGLLPKFDLLDKYWDAGVFSWFLFLFENYYPPADSELPSRWDAIHYVVGVFEYSLTLRPERALDPRNEPCLTLAIRMWLVTEYDYLSSDFSPAFGWWGPFLALIGKPKSHIFPSEERTRILENKLINENALIHLILKRFRLSLEYEDTPDALFCYLVNALSNFVVFNTSRGPQLYRMVRVLVDTFINIVDYLEDRDDNRDDNADLESLVDVCFKFLYTIGLKLERANSVEAVHVALAFGFLESIADFSIYFNYMMVYMTNPFRDMKSEIDERALFILTSLLPKYMLFDSVLHEMDPVLKMEDCNERIRTTIAVAEWETLCKLHEEMHKMLHSGRPFVSLCDNPDHDVSGVNVPKVKKCSGCESAWYCSESCQREHWNHSHRNACARLKLTKNVRTIETLTRKDHISACRIGITQAGEKLEEMEALAPKKYPGKTLIDLAMLIDYTVYPPKVDVVENDREAAAVLGWERETTPIQIIIPAGKYNAKITTMYYDELAGGITWFCGRSLVVYRSRRDINL